LELGARLANAGADLLVETLRENPAPVKQDPTEATYAPILKKEDGEIDWNWPATKIFNRSRGFLPWPGAYSFFRGQMFHIWKLRVGSDALQGTPGLMSAMDKRLLIACGERTELELIEVQVEGRKRMSAAAFMNGHHLKDDEMLGVKVA
jgi:methionyl-tRNA formyltransferase